MADSSMGKLRIVIADFVWVCILGVGVVTYKYWWAPAKEKQKKEEAVAEHQQVIDRTISQSKYTTTVSFAGDAFSGYAPIRSSMFRDECGKYGIRVDYQDDGANYPQRLKNIADGKLDMAVFTYDALIKTSADMGDFPATIVGLIDESKGADAIVAAGKRYPNIDAMNAALRFRGQRGEGLQGIPELQAHGQPRVRHVGALRVEGV